MRTTIPSDEKPAANAPWWRQLPLWLRDTERDAQALALEFARFLSGQADEVELRAHAAAAHPDAFWAALEAFTDNIGGDEWQLLSLRLHDLEEVRRERERLEHRSSWRRALAARHLGLLDAPDTRAPLFHAMVRGPALVTLTAALALARVRERRALHWLLRNPRATQRRSRHLLVAIIKRFGPGAAPLLRCSLRGNRRETPIALAAIEALGMWKHLRARRTLEALLVAGPMETRIAAARALGGIRSPRSAPALSEALADEKWEVRAQSARSLGLLGIPAAVQRLTAAMEDPAWWVRRNAGYALAEMGLPGERALRWVLRHSGDAFARDMASEVLEALEWERESPGGISRVE